MHNFINYDSKQIKFEQTIENNDLVNFKILIKHPDVLYKEAYPFRTSVELGRFDMVKIFLSLGLDPSSDRNSFISLAYIHKRTDILELLWNDKRVKNTLKNDYKKLYNKLIKKDIKNKIIEF